MMEFDGSPIASIEAKLPTFVVEMPTGYHRGTHLKMEIEFRVRGVRYEENRKGELVHQMILAVEEIGLTKVMLPEDEVVLLGAIESDGIPTDYGHASDEDTDGPDWGFIEGQSSIDDLEVEDPGPPESVADVEATDSVDVSEGEAMSEAASGLPYDRAGAGF